MTAEDIRVIVGTILTIAGVLWVGTSIASEYKSK